MPALKTDDDDKGKAQQEAANLMSAYPALKCIMAITSPAVPGAAEAVKQAGKSGVVKVLGLGLPSENRAYVKEGVTQAVILWDLHDLGYLTVTLDYKVKVSRRIREEFENGRHYYDLDGQSLAVLPDDKNARPAPEYLDWHNGIFKG